MWEKTVMSDEQLEDLFQEKRHEPTSWDKDVAKAQAEITGKIAYKEGEVAGYKRGLEMREPYKEGIRKVVEWLDSHNNSDVNLEVLTVEWQAFKKENGL